MKVKLSDEELAKYQKLYDEKFSKYIDSVLNYGDYALETQNRKEEVSRLYKIIEDNQKEMTR